MRSTSRACARPRDAGPATESERTRAEMADPSAKRYTMYPKELDDALQLSKMPPLHRDTMRLAIRMTVGKRGRPDAEISYGAVMKATGCSRSSAKAAVQDLVENRALIVVKPGDAAAVRANRYAVQWDYEQWGDYSVSPADIPTFLSVDYSDLWQPTDLGQQSDLGQQGDTACSSVVTQPGSAQRTDLGQPSAHSRDSSEETETAPAAPAPDFEDFWTTHPRPGSEGTNPRRLGQAQRSGQGARGARCLAVCGAPSQGGHGSEVDHRLVQVSRRRGVPQLARRPQARLRRAGLLPGLRGGAIS